MKKAVITSGGKQYLVKEGDSIEVELLNDPGKTVDFTPIMVIDGEKTSVGKPELSDSKVSAKVIEKDIQTDKVVAIRYKAKKRVRKVRGHRQRKAVLKIEKIT